MFEPSDSGEFVELDRRFRKLEKESKREEAALSSYTSEVYEFGFLGSGLGWTELLKERLIVILGEAGSGKTWELRHRADLLFDGGQFAFFIPLEALASRPISEILDRTKNEIFQTWKKGSSDAFFFLDSVDEAKFHRISDFLLALNVFRDALGDALKRARIFLSCRISEWRPETDVSEVLRRFRQPLTSRQKTDDPAGTIEVKGVKESILIVQIQPLDRGRVQLFANARGVSDAELFIRALDEHYAWEFARRPLDVVDLINYWKEKKELGTLTDLLEFSIERKLRVPERDGTDPLSPARAREGAEALAAASILCRQLNFRVPDAAAIIDEALDAGACLPKDWKSDEVRALLLRPIFDSATYGRIRFHHRRVGEYLAAKWFSARIGDGCPPEELKALLFEDAGTKLGPRLTLASVATWLCTGNERWNDTIRTLIAQTAPTVHLRYGDPETLPLSYKREVLNGVVRATQGRKHVWIESSRDSLSRLADPALASQISAIIDDVTVAEDVRAEMLQMVEYGRLTTCIESALAVIHSRDASDRLKTYAASAIRATGDENARKQLAKIAAGLEDIPNSLLGIICQAIYPAVVDVGEFSAILQKSQRAKRFGLDLPYYLKSHFEAHLTPEKAGSLLTVLLDLAQSPPHNEPQIKGVAISRQFGWLVKLFPCLLRILLSKAHLTPTEAEDAATALRILAYMLTYGHLASIDDETIKTLNAKTKEHPFVRQKYAWQRIESYRQNEHREPTNSFQLLDHHGLLQFDSTDFEWLVDDIATRPDPKDREVALQLAFESLSVFEFGGRNQRRIRRAIKNSGQLRQLFHKLRMRGIWFRIRHLYYLRVQRKLGNRWWWQLKFQGAVGKWQQFRGQWRLLTHLKLLASGKAIGWLALLIREADEKSTTRWAAESWDGLVKKRGRRIANATKQGCKTFWRKFVPVLPHEKPIPNQTDIRIGVGLTGIAAEIADSDRKFPSFSYEDAVLAARYGVNELNGFPPWFADLAGTFPTAVQSVLDECISGEWAFAAERAEIHEVMNKLIWQGKEIVPLVHGHIIELLSAGDPVNPKILQFALSIALDADGAHTSALTGIACQRVNSISPQTANFSLWMAVLLQLDAGRAFPYLEDALRNPEKPSDVMVRIASLLNPRGSGENLVVANPDYELPANLRRLIPLIYSYVRPQDDINRVSGETYTPGARDYAQEFRGGLISRLASDKSPDGQSALGELLGEPSLIQHQDWIRHLLEEQSKAAADLEPWTPADVREFAIAHEIDPKTDRDLFKIACKRFKELKNDVEKSENSLRDELRQGDSEAKLRRWLARKLNERAKQRFTVPQEAVIDLEERPDLRIENPKTSAVSVEVKWADERSANDLLERLENQLLGQYLRAHTSRYAVYLVGLAREREWNSPDGNRSIEFAELIEILTTRAHELAKQRGDVEEVAVFGIDFRQPIKSKGEGVII